MSRPKPNQLIKKQFDKDKWQRSFENQMVIAERNNIAKVKRYYRDNYNKGIDSFVSEGQTNFQLLFPTEQLSKMYRDMYADIGLQFANWYGKNYESLISKAFNPAEYRLQWEASFAALGSAVGAQRVTLVKGTALNTLQRITRGLMTDPEFMALGSAQKARILRNQFNTYSQYQAERLVRTESTNAANFAIGQSAKTIFPAEVLMKEWIASFDDRVRDTHSEAGASEPVKDNEYFMVGGNMMMYPGDPGGGAAEVINCRCSVAYFPPAPVEVEGDYTDIGFGIGGGSFTGIGDGLNIAQGIGSAIISGAQASVLGVAKTISEAKKILTDLFESQGFKISKTSMARSLSVADYNNRLAQLKNLFDEYNFGDEMNRVRQITLLNKSSNTNYGWIRSGTSTGALDEINLGDVTDSYFSRKLSKSITEFYRRGKSVVDEANVQYATLVHEMGHVLTRYQIKGQSQFFDELRVIRRKYNEEILNYSTNNNYKAFNEIFLGRYSQVNLNEFLAEGFTEYKLHSNPSKYARMVGELIDKYYKYN